MRQIMPHDSVSGLLVGRQPIPRPPFRENVAAAVGL